MGNTRIFAFKNTGVHANETTFNKFGDDGVKTPVVAEYRVSAPEGAVKGAGIKDKSKAGNPVIRLNYCLEGQWFNGTLNFSKEKLNEKSPDMFGSAKTSSGGEVKLAAWLTTANKKGEVLAEDKQYLSISISDAVPPAPVHDELPAPAVGTSWDDVPF